MELHHWQEGEGSAVVCVHETAASGDIWRPLSAALGDRARTIAYDRRGWGRSAAPEPYLRTTIPEQSEDTAQLIGSLGAAPALVCGAGIGAVVALDVAIRRPDVTAAAVLIEPPLLAFVPEATEAISADGERLRVAFSEGGADAALDLYLSGTLLALGPGAERIPDAVSQAARTRPLTLFAELGSVAAWELPLRRIPTANPIEVVVARSTTPLVRSASEALTGRLGLPGPRELDAGALHHRDGAAQLGELILGLL